MQLLGQMMGWAKALQKRWRTPAPATVEQPTKPEPVQVAGSEPGWLRILTAEQLLQTVKANKALAEIWRQSRQSEEIWRRDLLPGIQRYAEFVQLMPASEAHHHAHAGGLLSHTIEMLLAAMTWRNAHLLPEGSAIEAIDSQRDQWTYVVFYSALLHDIAKPLTDLRIQWRSDGLADSLRWMPTGGSLLQITAQRRAGEYLVDFTPKSQRDYAEHTRLAQTLITRIAPPSALSLLAQEPQAFAALEAYLCGQDKESLVAKIIKKADQISTQRALLKGSKARFATAKAIPLVDLLMQAMTSMLQSGVVLPLNRNGAAGWVFDGAVWFVAKRLADSVREWIKTHEPEEGIPGQAKNDRLFDTWQEYGVIDLNPATGQAIWYVEVHGDEGEQGGYTHEFAMLRFALPKLYAQESQYPAQMRGRLVIKDKRKADEAQDIDLAPAVSVPGQAQTATATAELVETAATVGELVETAANSSNQAEAVPAADKPLKPAGGQPAKAVSAQDKKIASIMRDPVFGKPAQTAAINKSAPKPARASTQATTKPSKAAAINDAGAPPHVNAHIPSKTGTASRKSNQHAAAEDAYLLDEDSPFLPPLDAAAIRGAAEVAPIKTAARHPERASQETAASTPLGQAAAITPPTTPAPSASSRSETLLDQAAAMGAKPTTQPALVSAPAPAKAPPARRVSAEFRDLMDLADLPAILPRMAPAPAVAPPNDPVLLVQQLPKIVQDDVQPLPEPSELVVDFMQWVQQGLVSRELKYNEAGAAVHFVKEGMALVSPRIFKDYAAQEGGDANLTELATKVQRELIKCGWHLPGPNRTNIVKYAIQGRAGAVVGNLACVVLVDAFRWVQPVPPNNPALLKD